jgi:RNA polymerase sigma-70 factor (ECF subfamily)
VIAWDEFVDEFGPMVYHAAFRVVGQDADAEDVLQDVFLEVYRLWEARDVANWQAVLRSLATRRAIDVLRRRFATQDMPVDLAGSAADPADEASRNEVAERLRRAIARLPSQQATVVVLSQLENVPHDQIASMLEITPGAVATALHKARRRLEADFAAFLNSKEH